ncbi:hypothetical protein POUND7_017294 [Theobroma cacao]
MVGNSGYNVYISNLDEKVSDRVLYDILIQAGRMVNLYIRQDKKTDKPKGFAFVEYDIEEIAEYAISGQDKASQNHPNAAMPTSNSSHKLRHYPGTLNHMEISQQPMRLSTPCRIPDNPLHYSQVLPPPGVSHHSNEYGSHFNGTNYEYSRRFFGATLDSIGHLRSRRYDTSDLVSFPYY